MLPEQRVGDEARERTVAALRDACAAGYITLDEFAERAGRAYEARTRAELDAVVADLPATGPGSRRRRTHRVLGIMGAGRLRGRWRPAPRVTAVAFWGGCRLDFRQAEIDTPEVEVVAVAVMGGVDIIVPEGVAVELTGAAVMGAKDLRVADVPPRPGTPLVRVRAFAFWGGVSVRSAPFRDGVRPGAGLDASDIARAVLDHLFGTDRAGPARDGTVTLLFSDIEGFTALTERLGDRGAQEVLRDHNALVRAEIGRHDGHEVKTVGDSFMVAFGGVGRALRCAVGIQRALATYSAAHPDRAVRVRIGLHTGEAIREGDDLFGRTVIVASRIADLARGGEILASSLVAELVGPGSEFTFDEGREVELAGIAGPVRVHALKWDV